MYQILLPQIKPMAGFNDFHNESFRFYEEINDYLDCSTCDYRATSWLIDPSETEENALLIAVNYLHCLWGICNYVMKKAFIIICVLMELDF